MKFLFFYFFNDINTIFKYNLISLVNKLLAIRGVRGEEVSFRIFSFIIRPNTFIFLDIWICRVGLGVKSDFRCGLFKYTKQCS